MVRDPIKIFGFKRANVVYKPIRSIALRRPIGGFVSHEPIGSLVLH